MTSELLARIPELEKEAEDYERKAHAIRQIIEGVRALNGHAEAILNPRFVEQNGKVFVAGAPDRTGPRGIKAVLHVMSEDPDRVWKVVELKYEILRRGWAPSPKAVEANVKRLRELGDVVPVRYGHYKLAASSGNGAGNEIDPSNVHSRDGEEGR